MNKVTPKTIIVPARDRGTLNPGYKGDGAEYQRYVSQFTGEPHVNTFSRSDGTDNNVVRLLQRMARY